MNCAPVTISGSTSTSFTGPRMHEANIFTNPNCNTIPSVDTVYPNPGPFVHFGGKYAGGNTGPPTVLTQCNNNVDELNNENLTVTGDGAASSSDPPSNSTSSSSTTSTGTATDDTDPADDPTGTGTSTSTITQTIVATTTAMVTPPAATTTVDGADPDATDPPTSNATSTSNSTSNSTSTSTNTSSSSNGTSTNTDDGEAGAACSPDGSITCSSDGGSFYMCNFGALVDMGSVAAGTTCSNGQISRKRALPRQLRRHHVRGLWAS
jgi:hypothetical protein